MLLARWQLARHRIQDALEVLGRAHPHLERFDLRKNLIRPPVEALRARLLLELGQLGDVSEWVKASDLDVERGDSQKVSDFHRAETRLTLARWLDAMGRREDASRMLDQVERAAIDEGCLVHQIEALVLRARFASPPDGEHHLRAALVLAAPLGLMRPFVDEGAALVPALHALARHSSHGPFVQKLLRQMPLINVSQVNQVGVNESGASLSHRELEVLRLMGEGLSNRLIAQRLSLSANTIKVHVRNIFAKLHVNRRVAAVTRARAMGVL